MPKMVKKADLPSKTCAACEKPFAWRKKWAKDWENVRFCSDRCRNLDLSRWLKGSYAIPVADDEAKADDDYRD